MTYFPEGTASSNYQHVRSSNFYRDQLKQFLDVILILLALPVLLPLAALAAFLATRDRGPALYAQTRIGKHGKPFRLWKFRSMVEDADLLLSAYLDANPTALAEWEIKHKLSNDPRITPLGKFLRRTSLDELPQLINVLKGEMSLVGPRPITLEEEALYNGREYYQLRPGITGPWQVSARNKTGFKARETYDDRYARSVSFWNDIKIMFLTPIIMLRGTGL